MTSPNYRFLYPTDTETRHSYCKRLEDDGHDEMFIRKALRIHWGMELQEFGAFFEDYPEARMRHVAVLYRIRPTRTAYSFALKLSRNLGISQNQAEKWIERFHKSRKASQGFDM